MLCRGWNAQAQWLSNRGYACLQVNFRGSTGYGKSFLHKGDKQWGIGSMQHDLTDAVAWAIKEGIADPEKVCIYGGSYGGYKREREGGLEGGRERASERAGVHGSSYRANAPCSFLLPFNVVCILY